MAGCMVLEDPAPDVCIRIILNFGHWVHMVGLIMMFTDPSNSAHEDG